MLFLYLGFLSAEDSSSQSIHLFVVIPSYNNSEWCEKNLESVFSQKYQNWTIYYVDDCSTDGTGDIVERYVDKRGMRDKCKIFHNIKRVGAMENLYNAIHTADPHSIVVTLDGDDFLADKDVFQTVVDAYADPEVWLTYGSYSYEPGGKRGVCRPIPEEVLANASIRKCRDWITSHLRTFYAGLFHLIKKEDLMVKGKFFEIAYDVAIMLPMVEMASPNHIRYIDRILYLYNYTNPLSDSRRLSFQIGTAMYICTLRAYKPIGNLFKVPEHMPCTDAEKDTGGKEGL
jgi:glycosyltransferase involved in cell wall biosynthesis